MEDTELPDRELLGEDPAGKRWQLLTDVYTSATAPSELRRSNFDRSVETCDDGAGNVLGELFPLEGLLQAVTEVQSLSAITAPCNYRQISNGDMAKVCGPPSE